MHKLDKAIISVSELLQQPALNIPAYQRPYKWTQQHLHALLDDIKLHSDKSAYRLGTVVFHSQIDQNNNGNEQLDIVDGQQRTLTLVLLVQAILVARFDGLVRQDVKGALDRLREPLNVF